MFCTDVFNSITDTDNPSVLQQIKTMWPVLKINQHVYTATDKLILVLSYYVTDVIKTLTHVLNTAFSVCSEINFSLANKNLPQLSKTILFLHKAHV